MVSNAIYQAHCVTMYALGTSASNRSFQHPGCVANVYCYTLTSRIRNKQEYHYYSHTTGTVEIDDHIKS